MSTSKFTFPNGTMARFVLTNKYLETLFILIVRLGNVMAKNHLTVPIQRFFVAFEKIADLEKTNKNDEDVSNPEDTTDFKKHNVIIIFNANYIKIYFNELKN